MDKERFRVIVGGLIARDGEILLGKKEEVEGHPISGMWHFPGGHLEKGEGSKEAAKREIEEETGLEVEVQDVLAFYKNNDDSVRAIFHCRSNSKDFEAKDDLQDARWVKPLELEEFLKGEKEQRQLNRPQIREVIENMRSEDE